jgi:hypothetical protein
LERKSQLLSILGKSKVLRDRRGVREVVSIAKYCDSASTYSSSYRDRVEDCKRDRV